MNNEKFLEMNSRMYGQDGLSNLEEISIHGLRGIPRHIVAGVL